MQRIAFGTTPIVSSNVVAHAIDPNSAERFWHLSEQLLKASAEPGTRSADALAMLASLAAA